MKMNHGFIIDQLAANAGTFEKLLRAISGELIHWKPSPAKWSILEVVNHLHDEEREDFRHRLRSVLENPDAPWPAIAPERWVTERGYSARQFEPSVASFLSERADSVKWLRGLSSPNWQLAYKHQEMGLMSAERVLANWLAHDYLHLRQIVVLKYGYLVSSVDPVSLTYAGEP